MTSVAREKQTEAEGTGFRDGCAAFGFEFSSTDQQYLHVDGSAASVFKFCRRIIEVDNEERREDCSRGLGFKQMREVEGCKQAVEKPGTGTSPAISAPRRSYSTDVSW